MQAIADPPSTTDAERVKASAFRDAGLSNGDDPKCSCCIDRHGTIHRNAFCPVVHEPDLGGLNSLPIAADTAVARIDRLRDYRMSLADPVFCEDAGSSGDSTGGSTG